MMYPILAFRVWWWVSLGIQTTGVAWLARRGPGNRFLRALWTVGLAGFWMNLGLGQIYAPLLALTVLTYHFLDDRPLVAGMCIGVIAAWKPKFLLWPGFLLVAGYWRPALSGLVIAGTLLTLPAIVLGVEPYRAWATALSGYGDMQVASNMSVTAWWLAALPMPRVMAAAGIAVVGASAWYLICRKRSSAPFCSDFALALAVALSPISWAGYTLILLPVFLRRTWMPPITLSAALLVIPANLLWGWSLAHPRDVFGPRMLYPLAITLLVLGVLRRTPSPEPRRVPA